ncbi:hypothetical protein F353_gp04 [Vibrio phage CP-T1]|uniref:hypothetical protein n=1 Tax=Vibrio phage CP-T1 TaxID=10689 RepID=UPI0002536C94|nr:hypothetical protein F353_gp04 [Vibrio phage CP-T1]AFC22386.1 hypothetical protein CP-T1_0004 [Vibrio phage CP-T1]AIA08691.1 hypothetical protein SBVc24_0002 [Vibrio phage 24]
MVGSINVTKIGNPGIADKYIRIDRLSIFGNPHHLHFEKDRTDVISKYETWFIEQINTNGLFKTLVEDMVNDVRKGVSINLMCHCAPKPCHGDVIKRYMESLL